MPYPSEEEHKVDNGWGLEDTEVKMNMDRLLEMLSKVPAIYVCLPYHTCCKEEGKKKKII